MNPVSSLITQLSSLAAIIVAWYDPSGALSAPVQGVVVTAGGAVLAIERLVQAYRHRTILHAPSMAVVPPPLTKV